jgi:Mannosyltransferase OCH1 and related enzymes
MIPKKIHYCWFGNGKKNQTAMRCIATWKEYMPDYEILEWNELNFDINSIPFTKEAYANKKFAFVSDYVRLYALYQHGGIYFDTDIEVLRSITPFLNNPAFAGYEAEDRIGTCVMGAEARNPFIKTFLDCYKDKTFNVNDLETNVSILGNLLTSQGVIVRNTEQNIKDILHLYPFDYFTAKSYETGKVKKTSNTYTIHHFSASWVPWYTTFEKKIWQTLGIGNRHVIFRMNRKLEEIKQKWKNTSRCKTTSPLKK